MTKHTENRRKVNTDYVPEPTIKKEYIERDEAIRKAISACIKVVSHGITQFDATDIADEIYSIPTADVVRVQHCEWKMHLNSNGALNHYECPVCHNAQGHISNYCEYCGTKMDGGAKNNG